jgi:LssY-like putative type I secretion system component LssY
MCTCITFGFGRLVPQGLLKHGFRARLFSAPAGLLFGLAVWGALTPALGLGEPQTLAWNLPPPHSAKSESVTIPAGTTIFARLETSVSTASSHLHSPVSARVVRDVTGSDGVLIPVGSRLGGDIETLIPSSSPTDRAKLLLKFTSLEIPGKKSVDLAAHLIEIENARETVLPTGAIQGLLQSEVPVSLLQGALEKWKKANPQLGQEAEKQQLKYLGKTSTAVEYEAGTDFDLSVEKPLALDDVFSPVVPGQISAAARLGATELLPSAPQRDSGKDGKPGDPLNLVIIGNQSQIQQVFAAAGWDIPQHETSSSLIATVRAAVSEQGYGKAPISDLYLYGQRENLAFEKMLNTFTKRHHLRLWRSPVKTADGREIWLGAATHDNGIDIHPGVVSHAIDPDLDLERAKVGADLILSGQVAGEELVTRPNPLSQGLTATGATWKTDGQLLAIELTSSRP